MDPNGNDHDGLLWDAKGALARMRTAREKFVPAVADVNRRTAEGELGPVGRERALRALNKDYAVLIEKENRPVLDRLAKRAQELDRELTTRPRPESKSADQAVESAFRRHRTIQRFEAFDQSGRNQVINRAREAGDYDILETLLNEPGLLNEETARRSAESGDLPVGGWPGHG